MKKVKLVLLMLLVSTTGLWAQTAYNPFTQNIHFSPEPTVSGFPCGSTQTVVFTQGILTADNATQWQTEPLQVYVAISGFTFAGANAAATVGGPYSAYFNWTINATGDTLLGTQNQILYGTGSSPLFSDPRSSDSIEVYLNVPEVSPLGTALKVNVNLIVPPYMAIYNSTGDDPEATQTQSYCDLKITGTVYHDTIPNNGTIDKERTITSNDSIQLCANLISPSGVVLDVQPISSAGTYEFLNVTPNLTYQVVLTNICASINSQTPTPTLPTNWDNTGDDCCDGTGEDGNGDGILIVPVTNFTQTQADFGIRNLTPTPVVLTNFNLSEYNCNTLISWATSSEENVSHFDILRKDNANASFNKIETIQAAGNSVTQKLYNFVDKTVEKDNSQAYQYKLQIVDNDGSKAYSNVESIKLTCGGDEVSAQIFPNPAENSLNIVYSSNENDLQLIVDIVDVTGRKLFSKSQIVYKGTSVINFDLESLAAGQYMVRYHGVETNLTGTIKFTKK